MYEHDLKYCPVCKDEYRADIENCAECGGILFTGHEMEQQNGSLEAKRAARSSEISIEDDLVVVRRGKLAEIKIFEKLLADENIGTLLAGDESSCGKGCCGGGTVDLVVKREDAQDAVYLIEEEIRRTSVGVEGESHADSIYNPEENETVCPACGHVFKTAPECPDCGLSFQIFLS